VVPFLDKKEVAQKEEGKGPPHIRRGRFTEFQGEDDGQPFKHRHRHLPLFKVKVGRFLMVVKESLFIWKAWMQWLPHVHLETELLAVHFQ